MMKRLISLILTVLLLFSLSQTVFAEETDCILLLSDKAISAGKQTTVTVRLKGSRIQSGNFILTYDPAALRLVSDEAGSDVGTIMLNDTVPGEIRVSFVGQADGKELLNMTFQAISGLSEEGVSLGAKNIRIYDAQANLLSCRVEGGSIQRDCASLTLSGTLLQDGTLQVEVLLGGSAPVAGGNFTLCYDARLLTPTALIPAPGTQASFTKHKQADGYHIAFAGTENLPAGKLCTATFSVAGGSGNETTLSLSKAELFNRDSASVDTVTKGCAVALNTVVQGPPALWVVCDQPDAAGTVHAKLLLQSRGKVCGGDVSLNFGSALTVEAKGQNGAAVNVNNGIIHLSFAASIPYSDGITLAELTFSNVKEETPLLFTNGSKLYDAQQKSIASAVYLDGKVGISKGAGAKVLNADCATTNSLKTVTVELMTAELTSRGNDNVLEAAAVLALYDEKGRMLGIGIEEIGLRAGTAEVLSLSASTTQNAANCRVFLLDEAHCPLTEALTAALH